MTIEDDNKKYQNPLHDEDDDQGEAGSAGGSTGEIEFRYQDVLSGPLREDLISPAELKRLLANHHDIHKSRVDNQKITRKERKLLKEGQASLVSRNEAAITNRARYGGGEGGGSSRYKQHPISNKAQFSGMDKPISMLPSENNSKTNEKERNEATDRNELKLRNQPRFNPKPRPY